MSETTTKKASKKTAQVTGIPVTADTRDYVMGERGAGIAPQLLEFLKEQEGQAFTEPMLATQFGFERDGKPHQQRVNGPMRQVWDRIVETGNQPIKGYELRLLSVPVNGRLQKAWALCKE